MNIDTFEQQEELYRLRAKLEAAEASRLAGAPTYTLEQVFEGLEDIVSDHFREVAEMVCQETPLK